MSKIKQGGQAFPRASANQYHTSETEGMTLRDWFAGQALAGAIAYAGRDTAESIAQLCFEQADAMLKAREQ